MDKNRKKALLLGEHVVNLIVAVLCIIVLVYLGLQIYNLYLRSAQKLDEAKYTLELLKGVIDEIKDEEGGKVEKEVLNPQGWYLISYSEGEESPKSCAGGDCLCICEKSTAKECEKKGVCEKTEISLKVQSSCYGKANCLYLEELPFTLFIFREKDYISLQTSENLIGETNLKEILEYKKDENSKKIEELVSDYLNASDSDKLNIREQIENSLESFFTKIDTEKLFELKKENFVWTFDVFEAGGEKPIVMLRISKPGYRIEKILTSNKLTFEERYIIDITYYKGYYEGAGSPNVGP